MTPNNCFPVQLKFILTSPFNFPPKINVLPKLTRICTRTWVRGSKKFSRKSSTFCQLSTNQHPYVCLRKDLKVPLVTWPTFSKNCLHTRLHTGKAGTNHTMQRLDIFFCSQLGFDSTTILIRIVSK